VGENSERLGKGSQILYVVRNSVFLERVADRFGYGATCCLAFDIVEVLVFFRCVGWRFT
jgi:hypothetical protein